MTGSSGTHARVNWRRSAVLAAALVVVLAVAAAASVDHRQHAELGVSMAVADDDDEFVANASGGLDVNSSDARAVVAAFSQRSYGRGATAALRLWHPYPVVRLEILHVGPERPRTTGAETINGVRVGEPRRVEAGQRSIRITIGDWESGVYAARLTTGRRVGYAPFIVRPRRLGESRVAVVQPTNTWQAYNFRDADGDGRPDTWYFDSSHTTVDVSRPYLDRGVPPHFRQYDLGFLRWLARRGKHVDMLAEEDVERLSGDRLARLYRLIVFPGHHEYVTTAEYDAVKRYRDLGGDLAFLSANNFFYRVDRQGDRLTRVARWRDLGRAEAALVGVQYFGWNLGRYGSRQYTATGVGRAPWLFARTGIENGDRFGWWGIEVDGRTGASPASTRVLALMPRAFGNAQAAEMTYYETRNGARVFAAGAFTLGGAAGAWTAARLLENLWQHLVEGSRTRTRSGA